MNDAEFDDFSRLWLEEGDPAETAEFRDLARRTEIRARLLRFADYGLAALVIAAVAIAFSSDTTPATILFGLLLGTAAVWATWKRRVLHQSALLALSDREALLDAAREHSRTELRQSQWGLLLFPLGIILAAVMQFSSRTGGAVDHILEMVQLGIESETAILLELLFLVLAEVYFVYRARRLRGELKRLDDLSEQYRRESLRDRDGEAAGAR